MKESRLYLLFLSGMVLACHTKTSDSEDDSAPAQVQTPVTVTSVSSEALTDYSELQATSSFLQDNIVKSNINGYVKSVNTRVGQHVNPGQTLFTLKTKEAESIGNAINKLDSSFQFSGVSRVVASQDGYITSLNHQIGDYVQDGEQLAVISNSESFG